MTKIATRDAYGKALVKLGELNKDVVVLDADLSKSTKTADFQKAYPERFFNLGIAEQNLMGVAAGFAAAGKIPFASTFAVFAIGRAYDQIRNTIGYPHLNVKIAATHAGLTVGEDGGSHQMLEDIALTRVIPGMTVIVPADGVETEQAVVAAAEMEGPVYLRLGRPGVPVIYNEDYKFQIGKASIVEKGSDVTIFATGIMLSIAIEAGKLLAEENISSEIINISTIKPLDSETIRESVLKTLCCVTCEEHNIIGGLGSAVAEVLAENTPVPMERVGVEDVFGKSGSPNELLTAFGLTSEKIAEKAKKVIKRK